MPTPVKILENQTKHLTKAEKEAREDAESAFDRGRKAELPKPRSVVGGAAKYWVSLTRRAEDIALLDDLDAEVLGKYCSMLDRHDGLERLTKKLLNQAVKADTKNMSSEETDKLDSLLGKLNKLDSQILAYADKLGFTPTARVRLAQRRAAAASEDEDPNSWLFGG